MFDDEDEYDEDDDLDEDDYEYEDDDNEDGYGSDDDNPSGYGEDPEPEDEDELKDDEQEKNDAKKSKRKDNGDAKVEVSGGKGLEKGKLDVIKMNKRAAQLNCGPRTHKICPFCKQKSIFMEPPSSTLIRGAIWYIGGMDRGIRYVCLNPRCKACYVPGAPKARFKDNGSGSLSVTHGIHTPTNPWSIRPMK